MSDKMRWRYGDTNPVVSAVGADIVVEIGDLVYQDVNNCKPASYQPDHGSELNNSEVFRDKFLGVSMQRSRQGETCPIRVATTGVFEFDCRRSSFELGDYVSPMEGDAGDCLENQKVCSVVHRSNAIARVAKRLDIESESVLVDIKSTVMTGGIVE